MDETVEIASGNACSSGHSGCSRFADPETQDCRGEHLLPKMATEYARSK